ncbi:hypothetical protein QUA43_30015 [Microcoleus sp. N9_B4]|uniref:hypothetical protein n=1 Tax=Microcoleus sp. N9_B4 TaxID=3055386 RepID=UPI002FCE6EB3
MKTQELSDTFASTTYPEFQNLMEFLGVEFNNPQECDRDCIKKFNQGKCDALFLVEPESEDFSYLCGWYWQTEKLIQSDSITLTVAEMFGEF